MRYLAFVVVAAASHAAAAEPRPEPLTVVPVDVDFCDFCKLVSTENVAGVGTVDVYDSIGTDKHLVDITVVIHAGHQKVGAHLAVADGAREFALRETHRVAGFHAGVVTDRRATPHDSVALAFDIERTRDGKSAPETEAIACTAHAGTWTCSIARLGSCRLTKWEPPALGYSCSGELKL